jgi:quinol monooxygenase YgiN
MTIGVIATLTVAEGKNAEFEALFKQLVEQVNAREEGCNFYQIHQSRSDSQVYKVLEQYIDQAAFEAHGKSDYFREIGGALGPCMAGPPDIELVDGI